MQELKVFENSSVDMMAAAIAKELTLSGNVTLSTVDDGAIDTAIQSLGIAKKCMKGYDITLDKAVSCNNQAILTFRARKLN